MNTLPEKLILIDGECTFCHGAVKWIEKHSDHSFFYSSLQSETGQRIRKEFTIPADVDSIIYLENGKVYLFSEAVLKIARHLSFPARLLTALAFIPRFIRNFFYKVFARKRYTFFGKKAQCELPEIGFQERVLQ